MKKVVIVPLLSALVFTVLSIFLFSPKLIELIVISLLLIFCSLIAVIVYFAAGFAKKDRLSQVEKSVLDSEKKLESEVKDLVGKLLEADQEEASKQADRLLNLLEDFRNVVSKKLGDSEMTLSSYINQSKTVFNLAKQNLDDILVIDISIRTAEIDLKDNSEEAIKLVEKQQQKILVLLDNNRELLEALNKTTVEVANIKDIDTFEYDEALNRLKELAKRAKQFSK